MSTATIIAVVLVIALVPAFIAARKTPSHRVDTFATYYVFGALLWIVALPVAIWVVKDERVSTPPSTT